ncbi:glycosyl hydrolase family 18 protein [Sulfobacillus thermosulfidooxidans]|uniref:glycosyl hydrolase family 18 protein n=1 Tax=Sulfobacillus thermosulfidooxidans TaxID=28034 RepID=UPI00096BA8D8|nr:glycosyl hydrolase family 18 protein [Sulfobacillus thermosulfidooxidans]OLZ11709.1 hypothetical protein BFX05_06860 [Sulfobacillus thermosulfidooxidans]OLZ18672.1 hypothetical protein BFX06_00455 [Sulfobacillus thermosulfidooxidans]OLZ20249.1 hypothetical protein BFX07_01345 [Sulfobacillus thermosulfidooxidans]
MRQTRVRRHRRSLFRKSISRTVGPKMALISSALILSQIAMSGAFAQSPVNISGYILSQNQNDLTINGQGFGTTEATVTIDGQYAPILSWSNTAITVAIPQTADPGPITVTTSQGLTSNSVTFLGISRGSYALSSNGKVTVNGNVPFYGDLTTINVSTSSPAVQLVPTQDYRGYWILTQDGHIYAFGDATSFPSLPSGSAQAVSMAVTPSGQGAYVLTQNGTVYALGNATNYGNATSSNVVSIATTPDGQGYWIVNQNGQVEAFGDAKNYGSLSTSTTATNTAATTSTASYPNGTLVQQQGTAPVWVVENGTLHHIPSAAMFLSMGYQWNQIQVVPSLTGMNIGSPLVTPYPSGTLLQVTGHHAIYLVMQGVLHHIGSWSTFVQMGLIGQPIVSVSQLGANWPMGPTLNSPVTYYPSGTLIQQQGTPQIYMVNNGVLQHIANASIFLEMGYQWNQVLKVSSLPNLPIGPTLTTPSRAFPTGTLLQVQGQNPVYLDQNGVLRHIPNPTVLYNLGYSFQNVVTVPSSQVIAGLTMGTDLESTTIPGVSSQAPDPSSPSTPPPSPAVQIVPTLDGQGYWILQSNGTVTAFGDAKNFGEPSPNATGAEELLPSFDQQGYDIITTQGQVYSFGDGPSLSVPSNVVSVVESPITSTSSTTPIPLQQFNGFLSMGYGFFVDNFPNGVNNSSFEDLLQHGNELSVINPAWFNLSQDASGNWNITSWSTQGAYAAPLINGLNNIQYVTQQAHQEGVMVLPSIGNYYSPGNGPISTPGDVTSLVQQIVNLVNQYNFDGITIDFENNGDGGLSLQAASEQYTNFIQQLGTALHQDNKLLMVAVYPSSYPDTIYNYQAIAPYVNFINMMAYPEHNSSTWPGPTAGYPWVSSLVQNALAQGVNPSQIILGVAPYGHEWTVTNNGVVGQGAVSYRAIQSLLQQQNITPLWDPVEKEIVFTAGPLAQAPSPGLSIQNGNTYSPQVANLQNLLNIVLLQYALQNGQTPRPWLWTDGYFGTATQSALEAFQQDFSVNTQTPGVYDTATAQALQQVINQWNIGQNIYWSETSRSIKDRIELALTNHLGGIAAWRLPFETTGYWTDMAQLTPVFHGQP